MAVIRESQAETPGSAQSPNGATGEQPPIDPDFNLIVGAPDLTALMKKTQSRNAKEYTTKVASGFKMFWVGSLHAGQYADAAAMLWHGPGAATAIGDLCDENERAAKIVDFITAPNSPILACALTIIPLLGQLARNHEQELQDIPRQWSLGRKARAARKAAKKEQPRTTWFTMRIMGHKIEVARPRFRPRILKGFLAGVRSQSQEPSALAARVFTDPDVQKALAKMGIMVRPADTPDE